MAPQDTQTAPGAARLAICAQTVGKFLDEQLEALLDGARQPLLVAARDAGDPDKEESLLAVMEEVDTLCPQACAAFRDEVLAKLQAPGGELGAACEDDGGGLDLVKTAKLDDWVRLRRLLGRHTEEARAIEKHVWERIADLAGSTSHPDDCPVSLQGVCVLFQGAMQDLGAGRYARAAIYDSFEATVVAKLGRLIAKLDTLLDGGDDLGDADTDVGEEFADLDDGYDTDRPAAEPEPADLHDVSLEAACAEAARDAGESSDVLADALLCAEENTAPSPEEMVDPARLLGALAGVQRQTVKSSGDKPIDAVEFESLLAAAVAPPGVVLESSEQHTLTVVARLVREVVEHPDVDAGVKRRLRRLAPPLLMLALQGDDYLEAELDAARHDPVTGLLDRSAFRARLELALRGATRGGTGPAVCLVEADELAATADRLGHQVGGRLLRALGELLRKHSGKTAYVARIRGNEFAVVLPAVSVGAGRRFSKRVLSTLTRSRFVFDGEEVSLRVSIGVVESDASLKTPREMMLAADAARHSAKAAGGGCVRVHGVRVRHTDTADEGDSLRDIMS